MGGRGSYIDFRRREEEGVWLMLGAITGFAAAAGDAATAAEDKP